MFVNLVKADPPFDVLGAVSFRFCVYFAISVIILCLSLSRSTAAAEAGGGI